MVAFLTCYGNTRPLDPNGGSSLWATMCCLAPNKQLAVTSDDLGQLVFWDLRSGRLANALLGSMNITLYFISLFHSAYVFATAGIDKLSSSLGLQPRSLLPASAIRLSVLISTATTPVRTLLSCNRVSTNQPIHTDKIISMVFSQDGQYRLALKDCLSFPKNQCPVTHHT